MTTRRHTKRRRTRRARHARLDGLGWIILSMAAVLVVYLALMR